MMNFKARLLGLAFAAADALVEVGADGCVAMALGAAPGDESAASWMGSRFADLFKDGRQVLKRTCPPGPGRRSDDCEALIRCVDGRVRRCRIRAFSVPELAPAVSYAIAYLGPAIAEIAVEPTPLLDVPGFMIEADRLFGERPRDPDLTLSFVTVSSEAGESAEAKRLIASTLQDASIGGGGAAKLSPMHYALLRLAGDARDIAAELNEAAQREGVDLGADEVSTPIPPAAPPLCALRALRFAIESCLKDGGMAEPDKTFSQSLKQTLKEAEGFRAMVRGRDFALHYQPIVDLDTRAVHHFEALARFPGDTAGPADRIHMAEELALIEGFDLAVVEKALGRMKRPGSGLLKIAVNVSAGSLATDSYVDAVLRMTAANPRDRQRLTIEITETAALADIDAANRRIAALRGSGVTVCIDDFGVGAASFTYLQRLSVDAVKIDGGFVRDLAGDPRARTMIRTMVELCQSMGLDTIAEMVETEDAAEALQALGVGYGQGWLFGRPEAEPRTTIAALPVRRKGVIEAWG